MTTASNEDTSLSPAEKPGMPEELEGHGPPEETREGEPKSEAKAGAKAEVKKPPSRRRKWVKRILVGTVVGLPLTALGLWIAIHRVEWLGPWLADTGRSIVGNDAIAKLEDWAYGVQDEYNQVARADEAPEAFWEAPSVPPPVAPPPGKVFKYPTYERDNVGPMHASFSAPGDGNWVPVMDARNPEEPAPLLKTLVHPDAKRGWAHVVVVAVDLRQVNLHLIAGTVEPMSKLPEAKAYARPAVIPAEHLPRALAAFNGGFKATHGHYGIKTEGVTFIEPRGVSCTIAGYAKDEYAIGSWEDLSATAGDMTWLRQAPACMLTGGELHPGLSVEKNTLWGATLDKDTVIRRSAIGLSADKQTLFVSISEATTAQAIAKAMQHAGAADVAQLDVNWSFPKFVTIEPVDGNAKEPTVKPIIKGFEYRDDDYVRRPATRDFFYLVRKSADGAPKSADATPPKDTAPPKDSAPPKDVAPPKDATP